MLDFSKVAAPSGDGEVLVLPTPRACADAIKTNSQRLREATARFLDSSVAEQRKICREAIAGADDVPVVALGHQPEFIHAGVWAKHVVAMRLAKAVGGRAINLVVDHDVPRTPALQVPAVIGAEVEIRNVPLASASTGRPYESIETVQSAAIAEFEAAVCDTFGDRFERSLMPAFCKSLGEHCGARSFAEQFVESRRSCEQGVGIEFDDAYCHALPWQPLLAELLVNAGKFAATYNDALGWYRREFHVRGAQRPIPDLVADGDRVEVAAWAFRDGEPRQRVHVTQGRDSLTILAGKSVIARVSADDLRSVSHVSKIVASWSPWRIRPRALTLTIFARLFLCDLFIHGVGGAKYDRITDRIIRNYFGIDPPEMACVSATLRLDLPTSGFSERDRAAGQRRVRDARWNSHRTLGRAVNPAAEKLITEHDAAVQESNSLARMQPHNRAARREAFRRMRTALEQLAEMNYVEREAASNAFQLIERGLARDRLARSRDFFFALHDREKLRKLLDALPAEHEFRV